MKNVRIIIAVILVMVAAVFLETQTANAASPESDFIFNADTGTIIRYSGSGEFVEIPDTINGVAVTAISEYAFSCKKMTRVIIPDGVISIGDGAFSLCSELTDITIPSSVTGIGIGAFFRCSGLTNITIPAGVTSISERVFRGCKKLTEITIPAGTTSIGNQAFYECTGLTNITIPDSVISFGQYAFYSCSGLKHITIPAEMKSIGEYAFLGCTRLTGIDIPTGVTVIGKGAFCDCAGLTKITIPAGVTDIGDQAFAGCSSLSQAVFRGNAPNMGAYVFHGYYGNFEVVYPYGNKSFSIIDGKWKGYNTVPLFFVTYDGNGSESGSVPVDVNMYEAGDIVNIAGNPGALAKTDCRFSGWNTKANGRGISYDEGDSFAIDGAGNITLYANWLAKHPTTASVAGSGKALDFSVNNTDKPRISVPSNEHTRFSGDTDFTVSMWIFPKNDPHSFSFLYRQKAVFRQLGIAFRFEEDRSIRTGLDYNSIEWGWNAGEKKIPLNQWTHVAMRKSGSLLTTYINGEVDTEVSLGRHFSYLENSSGAIFVGGTDEDVGGSFNGVIDEVQLWDTALSQDAIKNWMYREIDKTHPNYNDDVDNLVFYYNANEGTGTKVADLKGNHNGTLLNMDDSNWVDSNINNWITYENTPLTGELFGSDAVGSSENGSDWNLAFEIVSQGSKGAAVVSAGNKFTYTPADNQNGIDTFTYKVIDRNGNKSNTKIVEVYIIPASSPIGTINHYDNINSLTNSIYSVNPKTFADVENHWAKEAINDMSSRLVVYFYLFRLISC